ncbi:MAG TPA: transposase [Urbifossiella sp.]|nr:transposase [Urbifossiella sp.]
MEEPSCPGGQDLLRRVAQLEAQVADLTRKLKDAQRAGKRQAAPFRKGPPKPNPRPPGRKPDDGGAHAYRAIPKPEQVDETPDATLPDACPHGRGSIVGTEIPRRPVVRKFHIHIGRCWDCGQRIPGRHPLQTSDASGAAASQIGPDAQAAAALLHTQAGFSHGKVAAVFDTLFGITLTRGASAQINPRAADRLEPDDQLIFGTIPTSERVAADETGWRVGGHPVWLHVWVGDRATAYAIDPQRRAAALGRVIGLDWAGVLSHDGYSTYGRFREAVHPQCVAHLLRRARDLLGDARGGAVHVPRQVIDLFTDAVHWRNEYRRGKKTLAPLEDQRDVFDDRRSDLLSRPRTVPAHRTLVTHLWTHFEEWFTFVFDPRVEATNWPAEQATRPAVVNRKVWGGNRTEAGATAQGILPSTDTVVAGSRQPDAPLGREHPRPQAPVPTGALNKYL